MNALIADLKEKFPLVNFIKVKFTINPRNEDAFYPLGSPKPEMIEGDFIKIQNPMGGADDVLVSNIDAIYRLAAWHQTRAEKTML